MLSKVLCLRLIIIICGIMNCCIVGFVVVVVVVVVVVFSEGGKIVICFFRTFTKVNIYQIDVSFGWFHLVRFLIDLNKIRYSYKVDAN